MLKEISILAAAVLALSGCDSKNANAQNTGTAVGNPDSANVLIMEEGYEAVVVPAQNGDQNPSTQAPANANPQNNNNNDTPATAGNTANADAGTVTVDETISGITDGEGDGVYEVDETVSD